MIHIVKRKLVAFMLVIVAIAILIQNATYMVDKMLIKQDKEPKFSIIYMIAGDGGSTFYYGFGYQIINWNRLTDRNINGKEVEGIECGYETHRFPFYNLGDPKIQLEFKPHN